MGHLPGGYFWGRTSEKMHKAKFASPRSRGPSLGGAIINTSSAYYQNLMYVELRITDTLHKKSLPHRPRTMRNFREWTLDELRRIPLLGISVNKGKKERKGRGSCEEQTPTPKPPSLQSTSF